MAELNPNAKKWVEALRSGRFKQGKRALTTVIGGEEYDCCLGVACKVAIESGLDLKISGRTMPTLLDGQLARIYDVSSYGVLPEKVREWLGLMWSDGAYGTDAGEHHLTEDNDSGKTFEQIADIIESQPNGLFAAAGQ